MSFRRGKVMNQNPNTSVQAPQHIMRSTSMNYISNDHSRSNSINPTNKDQSRQRKYYPE